MIRLLVLVLLVCFHSLALATGCIEALQPDYFTVHENGRITFGIGGGARVYPKAYTLKNMGLSESQITDMQGWVLLIGEGYGQLLPLFAKADKVQVTAVDPIYGLDPIPAGFMGDLLKEFIAKYDKHLLSASSTDLPYQDNSIDAIYSHLLLNNFLELEKDQAGNPIEGRLQLAQPAPDTVRESIRVLKPGKSATFTLFAEKRFTQVLMDMVKKSYAGQEVNYTYTISTHRIWTNYRSFGNLAADLAAKKAQYNRVSRLTVTKVKP